MEILCLFGQYCIKFLINIIIYIVKIKNIDYNTIFPDYSKCFRNVCYSKTHVL